MIEITHQLLWSPQPNDEHKLVLAECERVMKMGGTFKIENRHMKTWYSIITIYYPETKP